MAEPQDVIELLIRDHRRLAGMLEQLDREDRPVEMHALFVHIAGDLAAHEAAERDVVFPALRAAAPDEQEVLDLLAEHEEVNSLLAEMRKLDPASFGFMKRASALVVELEAHFAEEEGGLFPHLRAVLDPAELVDLAGRVRLGGRAVA